MQLTSARIAVCTFGIAMIVGMQPAAYAGPAKSPTASQKLTAQGGGRSRAQPGDTCLGISACNTLIVECIQSGHDFKPIEDGPNGEPYYGQCVRRTD
jgi:hypothetical protein